MAHGVIRVQNFEIQGKRELLDSREFTRVDDGGEYGDVVSHVKYVSTVNCPVVPDVMPSSGRSRLSLTLHGIPWRRTHECYADSAIARM